MTPLVTFIIPTIGRETLERTLNSLKRQVKNNWNAVVICDGWDRTYEGDNDPRIHWVGSDHEGSAGALRNKGIAYAKSKIGSEWVAFVDDDDTIDPIYTTLLAEYSGHDAVIFRMMDRQGRVLPDLTQPRIAWGHVGISYAVRAWWFPRVVFIRESLDRPGEDGNEDINLLRQLQRWNADIFIAPHAVYYVRHDPIESRGATV